METDPVVKAMQEELQFMQEELQFNMEQLIPEAQKEGLDHTYIITGEEGSCLNLIQIDVKTGEETLIDAEVPEFDRKDLMHVIWSLKEEFIDATGFTNYIVPERILFERLDTNIKKSVKAQKFQLVNPALRQAP